MVNPWIGLPSSAPFVLPEDRPIVEAFNARLPSDSSFQLNVETVIPEPFIGAVTTAPVLILQLNPGLDPINDPISHADPQFREALIANLSEEQSPWPFYYFDPRFRDAHGGGNWWQRKTERLAETIPFEDLGQRLAVVEWFPYKSSRFKRGCRVPSQEYGFSLVSAAMKRGALIVISRSVALWQKSVPALQAYPRKLTLSSTQNVVLSANNVMYGGQKSEAAWNMLIKALS